MASEGVLAVGQGRVAFFHETFFDYCFARQFLASGASLRDLLTGRSRTCSARPGPPDPRLRTRRRLQRLPRRPRLAPHLVRRPAPHQGARRRAARHRAGPDQRGVAAAAAARRGPAVALCICGCGRPYATTPGGSPCSTPTAPGRRSCGPAATSPTAPVGAHRMRQPTAPPASSSSSPPRRRRCGRPVVDGSCASPTSTGPANSSTC